MAQDQEGAQTVDLSTAFDMNTVIRPFLDSSNQAAEWSENQGYPPLRSPAELDVVFNPDLSVYSSQEIGTFLNKAQELKGFYGRVVASLENKVNERVKAIGVLKKKIKVLLLEAGWRGAKADIGTYVDVDERVVAAEQSLERAQARLNEIRGVYKMIEGKYKTLSRNVTLIVDDNETHRRVDRVEGRRYGQDPYPRRSMQGRRADRVAQQSLINDKAEDTTEG